MDVRALINHDPTRILGRTKSGTLKLADSASGLNFRVELPDTGYARDLHESIKRGDISQCSFAFTANEDEWTDEEIDGEMCSIRTLKSVTVFDVSAVTYPAYEETSVSARDLRAAFDERMKKAGQSPVIEVADPIREKQIQRLKHVVF
jgi:uncharacterized protein